eukprot:403350958
MPLLSMKTKTKLLMALGVYSATSYYFLRHPELLHRKKDKLKLPQLQAGQTHYVIAHRGGSLENPENTLQAFQHAVNNGVHILETDVRLTKDGELLTFHDADFHRLSGQDNSVNDTHYEQMPQIQDQIPLHFSKNERFHLQQHHQRTFTTLEELFQSIPKEVVVQIEIKEQNNEQAIRKTLDLINKYQRQSTTIIGVQAEECARRIHEMDPEIPKFISAGNAVKYFGYYLCGLMPFVHVYEDVASLPYMTRDYVNMKLIEAKTISWKYYLYIVGASLINYTLNPMLTHLNKRGVFTNYWVINDDDEILKIMRTTTVQAVMTDRPTRAQQLVDQKAQENIRIKEELIKFYEQEQQQLGVNHNSNERVV